MATEDIDERAQQVASLITEISGSIISAAVIQATRRFDSVLEAKALQFTELAGRISRLEQRINTPKEDVDVDIKTDVKEALDELFDNLLNRRVQEEVEAYLGANLNVEIKRELDGMRVTIST